MRPLMREGARGEARWVSMDAAMAKDMLTRGNGQGPGLDRLASGARAVIAVDPRQLDRVAQLRALQEAMPSVAVALGHATPWLVQATRTLGDADGWIALPRWERATAALVWGADPTSTGLDPIGDMRALTHRDSAYRRKPLVVVDPRLSEAATKADVWLPVRPGGDLALAWMLLKVWAEEGIVAPPEEWIRPVLNQPWNVLERASGLGQVVVSDAARLLAEAKGGLAIRMGGGVGSRGAEVPLAILQLAAVLGATSPGGAMEPTALPAVLGERPADHLQRLLVDEKKSLDVLVVVGDGGLSDMPARAPLYEALRDPSRVGTLIVVDSVMNPISALADFVVPDLTEHERKGLVVRSDGTSLVQPVVVPAAPEATGLEAPFDRGLHGFLALLAEAGGTTFDADLALDRAIAATGEAEALGERGWVPAKPAGSVPPAIDPWRLPLGVQEGTRIPPLSLVTYREPFGGYVDSTAQYWLTPSFRSTNAAWVHPDTAREIGLLAGDRIELVGEGPALVTEAKVTHEIRPGVIALALGYGHAAGYDGRTLIDGEWVQADPRRTLGIDAAALGSASGTITARSAGPRPARGLFELLMPPSDACSRT